MLEPRVEPAAVVGLEPRRSCSPGFQLGWVAAIALTRLVAGCSNVAAGLIFVTAALRFGLGGIPQLTGNESWEDAAASSASSSARLRSTAPSQRSSTWSTPRMSVR